MAYLAKRVGQSVITILIVITITFALVRLMPGGPMVSLRAQLVQQGMSSAEANELIQTYLRANPQDPLYVQYFDYVTRTLQGDLGVSIWYDKPVIEIVAGALPWTVFIMSSSLVLSFGIGILGGAAMAYLEGSRFDVATSLFSTFVTSVPYYLFAIGFLFIFGYQLGWFPTSGQYNYQYTPGLNINFMGSAIYHAVLPVFSLVLTGLGNWALLMRGNSIQVLGSDYLRVARLSGLSERTIITRYVTVNAILPMYTNLMISIGFLFGGSVVLEQIFTYQGLGYYIFDAIEHRDYPLLMGGFLVITVAVVASLFIADLTYSRIDPRTATEGETQ